MAAAWSARRGVHYGLIIAAAGSLSGMAGLGFGRFSYPVILPSMALGLGLSVTQSGLVATANLVGFMLAAALSSLVAARLGASRAISTGLLLTSAGLLGTGLAPVLPVVLVTQVLTGIGCGFTMIPAVGLLTEWFTIDRRGTVSGGMSSGAGLALLLAGAFLPQLIAASSWRVAWFILAALVFAVALASLLLLRDRPSELGLQPFGSGPMSSGPRVPVEASSQGLPVAEHQLLRQRTLWLLSLMYLCFGLAYTSYSTFLIAYLTRDAGVSPSTAGVIWGGVGIVGIVGSVLWGRLSDQFGRRSALASAYAGLACSFLGTVLLPGPLGYVLAPLVFGLTFFSVPSLVGPATADYFPARQVYAAYGVLMFVGSFGQVAGPLLGGIVADQSGHLSTTFLLAAASSLTGLGFSLALPHIPRTILVAEASAA